MKFEYIKYLNLIFSRTKRAFQVKKKTFFQVPQVLFSRHEKATNRDVPDASFKAFTVIINDFLKFFFSAISHLKDIFMGAFTYMVLKAVSSLMADWNVVSSPESFILFRTSSHIFFAKNIFY